jgi:hypothetical protein
MSASKVFGGVGGFVGSIFRAAVIAALSWATGLG